MKSAARKTPVPKPAKPSGDAATEEPAIDEHPETPGEQTIAFRPIRDDDPAPQPASESTAENSAEAVARTAHQPSKGKAAQSSAGGVTGGDESSEQSQAFDPFRPFQPPAPPATAGRAPRKGGSSAGASEGEELSEPSESSKPSERFDAFDPFQPPAPAASAGRGSRKGGSEGSDASEAAGPAEAADQSEDAGPSEQFAAFDPFQPFQSPTHAAPRARGTRKRGPFAQVPGEPANAEPEPVNVEAAVVETAGPEVAGGPDGEESSEQFTPFDPFQRPVPNRPNGGEHADRAVDRAADHAAIDDVPAGLADTDPDDAVWSDDAPAYDAPSDDESADDRPAHEGTADDVDDGAADDEADAEPPAERPAVQPEASEPEADADADADAEADREPGGAEGEGDGGEAGVHDELPAGGRVQEVPLPEPVSGALTGVLRQLRVAVKGLHFGLDVPGADEARKAQNAVLAQLDDYVIPRVRMSTAPALIVVAGSTGAGKSTLVNTLAAQNVTATGVRRPTTATPVLACHPDDHEWFSKGDLLGGLTRVERADKDTGPDSVVLVQTQRLPQGVALLDTPDIDSVVEEHHEIAYRLLDAADLWVFVTTAARYADAPSWGLLRRAKERGARLVIVLSRVPAKSRDVIVKHFGRMLDEYGMGDVERFVINETTVREGRLSDTEVTELRMWLAELSVDDQRRSAAVQATLNGVLNSFKIRLPALARHLETQVALRADLRSDVDAAYMGALAEIDEATRNGSLLRGEVLARWQDFAGSGDLMRTLQLRRGGKAQHQGPERLRALKSALRTALESVITSAAQRAAEEVVTRWRARAGAGDRLAATPGLGRPSDEIIRRTARTITAWQDHVTELIRTEGVTKRSVARLVSFDVESLSLIFTVGLLGYGTTDVSVDSGNSALPQRLLRGLLGAESLRSISAKARSDLRARIGLLFDEETLRYVDALDSAGIPDEAAATRLYQATYNLEVAR
ncbi:GTPase [Planotetraspora sp. GP83]|uniref:GTPase n=1 Tax=Planotetraspora sp. GP83 TaxID=3156264 RepID=UPI003517C77D